MRWFRRLREGRAAVGARAGAAKGQATVEMAVVLPVLIWLLVGMVDVGQMVSGYLAIGNAAREAVRLGIVGADDATITQRVRDLTSTLDPARVQVVIDPAGFRDSGFDVKVTITYNYEVMALMGVIGSDVPLTTSLIGRVE